MNTTAGKSLIKKQWLCKYSPLGVFFFGNNEIVYHTFFLSLVEENSSLPLTLMLPQIFLYSDEEDFSGDLLDET